MTGAFWGWKIVLATLLPSLRSGGSGGVLVLLAERSVRGNRVIPFGPFIAASAVIALFYGPRMLDLYWAYLRG